MNKDALKIALCSGFLAATCATTGHYWNLWEGSYFVAMFGALGIATVFGEL